MQIKFVGHIALTRSVEAGLLDEFIEELAEKLMLDELLCGEANPVEFLKEQIIEASNKCRLNFMERRLNSLRDEVGTNES